MGQSDVQRDYMVDQFPRRGVTDPRVLEAMRQVPREAFLAEAQKAAAYDDAPQPIEEGQTISQPSLVGLMLQAAEIGPQDRVLEVGAGSGYAAAVASRLAGQVFAVERHALLARSARQTLADLGCENVQIRHADGSHGWPEADPFNAIIVSCGAPAVPEDLKEQLAVGGRLIIPVGDSQRRQHLLKITRRDGGDFDQEDMGEVSFVPLIGEFGWREKKHGPAKKALAALKGAFNPKGKGPAPLVAAAAEPLPDADDPAFGAMFDRFADAKVVMLGEATHGTSEFYAARAAITRRLIEEHGFNIVAAEADWPDAKAIDRYVRHLPLRAGVEAPFRRFPTWMWRNHEFHQFTEWLRSYNEALPREGRAGFYGLDLYSMSASIDEVLQYLKQVDPELARTARARYSCLTPWEKDPAIYGRAAITGDHPGCERAVLKTLGDILARRTDLMAADGETFLDATANARLIAAAERYYRVMYFASHESWNLRDQHMFETLQQVLDARGPEAKAVVWAHNSHIGDSSATEMGTLRKEMNIGCLARKKWGDQVRLIGFGTDHGTVAAASDWDGPMEIKRVRAANEESYERICLNSGVERFLLDLREDVHFEMRHALWSPRLERAIGVIYRPQTEMQSHYFEASLPQQFDAYVWFAESHAVAPLPADPPKGMPETYPFGV